MREIESYCAEDTFAVGRELGRQAAAGQIYRSEEHTSELQSR